MITNLQQIAGRIGWGAGALSPMITPSVSLYVAVLTLALAGCLGRDKATAIDTGASGSVTIGGTLSGLASGESVVLELNGANPQTVSAGGHFAFTSGIAANESYSVTVVTPPPGQTCTVAGGSGTATSANVANIVVTCSDQPFTLGGTITGLGARTGLILKNGADSRAVAANATSFVMPKPVNFGSTYAVTVQSAPSGLACTVSRGAGTMPASNVTNVVVTCANQVYTLGGSVTGLTTPGLVLANGSDTRTVLANATSFSMPAGVANGSTYNVTVKVHPPLVACTVTNGQGTVAGADITNVMVTCTAGTESVLYSFGATGDAAYPYYGNLLLASDGNFYGTTEEGGANNEGAVFEVTPLGVETVLWSFAGGTADGSYPYGGLVQGSDGNFYGLTSSGGTSAKGTMFKITPAGAETVLWSFGSAGDGQYPYDSLILGTDGNFYATAYEGGANGAGTVFKITTAGVETVLYSFQYGTDGTYPYTSGLVQGSDGNFYGMTYYGGTNNKGAVFKVTPAGAETVLWSFGGTGDGQYPYDSLIQGTDGDFYATTYGGGANGAGTVFKITPTGAETVLWSFGGGSDGTNPTGSLVRGPDGNFYGLTYEGGANDKGIIFQLTPSGGTETTVWSFGAGSDGYYPYGGITFGPDGTLYGLTEDGGTNAKGALIEFN